MRLYLGAVPAGLRFGSGFEPYQVSARVPGLHKQEFYLNVIDFKLSKRLRRDKKVLVASDGTACFVLLVPQMHHLLPSYF